MFTGAVMLRYKINHILNIYLSEDKLE